MNEKPSELAGKVFTAIGIIITLIAAGTILGASLREKKRHKPEGGVQKESNMNIALKIAASVVPLLVLVVLAPGRADAHGAGMTFTSTTTDENGMMYLVDVDYSDLQIEAQRIGRFDFNLFENAERTKSSEFTDMWVRITQMNDTKVGKTIFAGGIAKQEFGGDGFSLVFPKGGTYKLNIRYNNASEDDLGDTVAEAEFFLDVLPSEEEQAFKYLSKEFGVGLGGGILLLIMGGISFWWWRKKYA